MSHKLSNPIFYDPLRRRWRRFQRAIQLIVLGLVFIFVPFIASIVIHPVLPNLRLSSVDNNQKVAQVEHPSSVQLNSLTAQAPEHIQFKQYVVQSDSSEVPTIPVAAKRTEAIAFYVNWDDNSFTSLKQNISHIDKLIPEWLHLSQNDGTIAIDNPLKQKQTLTYIREHKPELKIIPLINNFDSKTLSWDGVKIAQMLNAPQARGRLIQNLLEFVKSNEFAGISIDFESVPASSQPALIELMRELYAQFHPLGLEVSESVPPDDPTFDFRPLANFNDYLILMNYDENASPNEAGAVASHKWYIENLQRALTLLPPEKCVIGIGNYGYDWKANQTGGKEVSFQDVIKLAQQSKGQIKFDEVTLNPTLDYYDEKNQLHHVWFLDGVTAFNQLLEGERKGARGFALWRLGTEDPTFWEVLAVRNQLNNEVSQKLRTLHYGYDLQYQGQGEVLKVTTMPQDGSREISYDVKSGLVVGEHLTSFPSPYIITRWGAKNKQQIALTFDDGPDEFYTPRILDILRRYKVRATFFIMGLNATSHPELLQRIVREGHEIGNHTFTHPNLEMISTEQLSMEINATQRLFESYLGLQSLLFRPPYGEDIEPATPEQVKPLGFTSKLGYYNVGMHIEPGDWRNPGVDKIVRATIDQAVSGEGNIVLLHDSGGDRSQTIAALPQIIQGLRAKGFKLVTVSNLIGVSRDAVMPRITTNEQMLAKVNQAGFLLMNWFSVFTYYLFFVAIDLGTMRLLFIATLAVYEWFKRRSLPLQSEYLPSVSVIVPAFNEEKVILKTIRSILHSHYPNFNIIVVDDGSGDRTYQEVVEAFGNHPQIQVLTKRNGGKAKALNYGINQSKAEIIVALDADTLLHPEAIGKLVRHFINPHLGAIAGNAKVGNRINLLTYWQALEYVTSQNLERRAFGLLNCISVVPGAIGAWRRQVILQAGGFSNDTLAEDADLTLTILRMGYKIDYDQDALAYTEAPDTIPGFLNQRFRWMYGTLQAVWKHRDTLFRPRYHALGIFAIPNVIVFQIGFPLVSPLMDLLMLTSIGWAIWQQHQHPTNYSATSLQHLFFYYLLFLAVDFLAALIAFLLERKEDWRLLIWLIPQRFFYRQLMYYVAIKSTFTAIQGRIVGWGGVERKASVPST